MRKKNNSHKKQHFVPQCYTKAWNDPNAPISPKISPYVWVFERDGSNARKKSPVNIFTETDIYTITRSNGERDLRLENGFQELEDKFTRIRNLKFSKCIWPQTEDLVWLFAFVATAQARTVAHRDFHRQQWTKIRKRMEDLETSMSQATPEQIVAMQHISSTTENSVSSKGMTIDEVRSFEAQPIQNMIELTTRSIISKYLEMYLCILCTDDPVGFVTTDRPCTWFDPNSYRIQPIFRNPGLNSRTIEVTLPISPKQCLFISHNPDFQGYVNVDQHTVDELNRRHIAHSSESFISNSQTTKTIWFEHRKLPEDAWENMRDRKIASGEWPSSRAK